MDREGKSKHYYENLIYDKNPIAAAIGHRPPYHLAYIRKYSTYVLLSEKTGCTRKDNIKKP